MEREGGIEPAPSRLVLASWILRAAASFSSNFFEFFEAIHKSTPTQ